MAMIDYGALLRVKEEGKDWNFVNKNTDLFMEISDTGYMCKKATDINEKEYDIDGNYFVYAGDEHFLVVFYKGMFKVISDGKILYSSWGMPFCSETRYFDNLPSVKISRLTKKYEWEKMESWGTWQDYVKDNWVNATGNEKLSELQGGKRAYRRFARHAKRVARENRRGGLWKFRPYRFLAEWEYNGRQYQVIFGYGLEPDQEVWNKIKDHAYDFRKEEKQLIDSWFAN